MTEYAFPCDEFVENGQRKRRSGMTLRDYFAVRAMQVFAVDHGVNNKFRDIASDAYHMADAMLAERNNSVENN